MTDLSQSSKVLRDFIARRGSRSVMFATDLDGTALPLHHNPAAVRSSFLLRDTVDRLTDMTQGKFVIVTGRNASFVDDVVFPNRKMAGSFEHHACARLDQYGPVKDLLPRPDWDRLDPVLNKGISKLAHDFPGAFLEHNKTFSRTLHFRPVAADQQNDAGRMMMDFAKSVRDMAKSPMVLKQGNLAIEMGPHGSDKGAALQDFVNHHQNRVHQQVFPIFAGDSGADVSGAQFVKRPDIDGLFISVGGNPELDELADIKMPTPESYVSLLAAMTGLSPEQQQKKYPSLGEPV